MELHNCMNEKAKMFDPTPKNGKTFCMRFYFAGNMYASASEVHSQILVGS